MVVHFVIGRLGNRLLVADDQAVFAELGVLGASHRRLHVASEGCRLLVGHALLMRFLVADRPRLRLARALRVRLHLHLMAQS